MLWVDEQKLRQNVCVCVVCFILVSGNLIQGRCTSGAGMQRPFVSECNRRICAHIQRPVVDVYVVTSVRVYRDLSLMCMSSHLCACACRWAPSYHVIMCMYYQHMVLFTHAHMIDLFFSIRMRKHILVFCKETVLWLWGECCKQISFVWQCAV